MFTEEEKAAIINRYLADPVIDFDHLMPWHPMASPCPKCSQVTLELGRHLFTGRAIMVRCTSCKYRSGFANYIGPALFPIQPMPEGALPIYDKDPEAADLVEG